MLNFETGRKLTILGFLAYAVLLFLQFIGVLIASHTYGGSIGFYKFSATLGNLIFIGIACAFAIKFLTNRDLLDLLTGGAIGITGLISLFGIYGHNTFWSVVIELICASYMLGMAMRARNNSNQMFFMGFCAAFVLTVLGELFIYRIGIIYWLRYIIVYGFQVVVALACAFECNQNSK